ncbi:hypothetical protein N7492_009471 [Penicillium capsulatum]|uniref:Uncharacterized protein n=1 Tax=Penicillium capsulatum TaxID=69766 RepID=A0A9W9HRT3_9EURO|nr:hypothetical protein N7492_009471 [Penicillium capsulatum]KAJ6106861.1 hypothetical protein N7512_010378 [Penicillium capsulatum]
MVKVFHTMANLMKKFKRKRRLSSELHSRWGDTGISFPTHGSWNQWDHMNTNVPGTAPQHARRDMPQEPLAMDPVDLQRSRGTTGSRHRHIQSHGLEHADEAIPKGYFDENIRHRPDRHHHRPSRGLGIDGARPDMDQDLDSSTDESCDEDDDDEGRDTLGEAGLLHRGHTMGRDEYDSYPDHASKSPPLSVTSRMRRVSLQSSTTEHSSASRHTSYTGASSVSAPSLPPDTPRFAFNSMHAAQAEKRPAPRPRPREPEPAARQEMVPGYDELYG